MEPSCFLFDADDTLFDFRSAAKPALLDALRKRGHACGDEMYDTFQSINRPLWNRRERGEITLRGIRDIRFRLFFEEVGIDDDPITFDELFVHHLSLYGRNLLPNAEETVKYLSGKYRLAIITNGISHVQHERFDSSVIAPYFDRIFVSDDMGVNKPDKAFFDRVFDELGIRDPSRVMIVGDSLTSDIRGGKNCGAHTCLYDPFGTTHGDIVPDMTIHDLIELTEIF